MKWLDVAGAPGSGKSTLCDDLWPPRCIPPTNRPYPPAWNPFLACVNRLLAKVSKHPTYRACESMTTRSLRKMTSVHYLSRPEVYIQTGFAQRGLGIGWRLPHPTDIAEFYQLMPISRGVALLSAPVETICHRNVARGKNRSYMVPQMERPREIAVEVLRARGVPLLLLDTRLPPDENRQQLLDFARP